MVYRISLAKSLRGGTNMFKDTVDYFKRMGLLNTPGQRMYMEGDNVVDKEYGMKKIFNTATLEDFTTYDPIHTEIGKAIRKAAIANGATADEATAMSNRYMTGVANATDGLQICLMAGGLINKIDLSQSKKLNVITSTPNIHQKMIEKINNF